MHRVSLIAALLCLLTSGPLVVANTNTMTMSPTVNSSDSAAKWSIADTSATVSSLASSPSSFASSSSSPSTIFSSLYPSSSPSSSVSQSTSPSSSSSTASFSSSTTAEGGSFSSSVSASTSIISSSSSQAAPAATTTTNAAGNVPKRQLNDATYIPMVAAIVSGFCLLFLLLLLFLAMALVYRYLGKEDSTMMLKKPKKGTDAFYDGLEPQSAQYLVSSMSLTSFGSSPSDARLDSQSSPTVHYNRGFDVDHNPSGAGAVGNGHEESYRPIQIVAADVTQRPTSTTHV